MRPEVAAGVPEAQGRLCQCPGNDPQRPPPPRGPESSSPAPWRPWMLTPGDAESTRTGSLCMPGGGYPTLGSKGAFGFQHPVRLYLPISKREEYLQSSGEKVLASFPLQATIHFYNDESGSDSEEDEQEKGQTTQLQCQEDSGPAAKGSLNGEDRLPRHDSPGSSKCSSLPVTSPQGTFPKS